MERDINLEQLAAMRQAFEVTEGAARHYLPCHICQDTWIFSPNRHATQVSAAGFSFASAYTAEHGNARSKPSVQESPNEFNLELTIEEFREKIGPHLGAGTTQTDMDQLFMKIDADCGGTVDW